MCGLAKAILRVKVVGTAGLGINVASFAANGVWPPRFKALVPEHLVYLLRCLAFKGVEPTAGESIKDGCRSPEWRVDEADGTLNGITLASPLNDARSSEAAIADASIRVIRRLIAALSVSTFIIIQMRDGTPTGPASSVSFFIRGIRGLGSRFTSTKLSRGVTRPSCAVAFLAERRTGGWRFRRGCSTGRSAQAGISRLPRVSALLFLTRWRGFSRTQACHRNRG